MYSSSCCLVFIVAATTATAVLSDTKPTENPQLSSTLSPTSATASPKSSDDPEDDITSSGPRKRTIEQTVGYGYRYNTVLRPVGAGSTVVASLSPRSRPAAYQRATVSPMTPSPTPASYYFQQQVQSTSPKPLHRFNSPFTSYPRYNRPEPSETRPVTENPLPMTATASLQPQQDLYREIFTFDEAVASPYHIAPRAEHPQVIPQALFLTPAGPHLPGHQQVIPVLILRLDTGSPFPYPMMAILREDLMSKMYAQQDPALQLQQYGDPALDVAYFSPETHHQARRVQPMTPSQPDPYRSAQEQQVAVVGKVPVRRPSPGTSAGNGGAAQGTRTEVTIHHSPGMTAQDYKESIEQEDEAV